MLNRLTQRGMSLIELIVAMAIGVVISAALAGIFVGTTKMKRETALQGEQIENGRLAMEWLSQDLRVAGYWDGLEYPGMSDPALPSICASSVANLKDAALVYVQGVNGAAANALATCASNSATAGDAAALADVKPGTDIVMVRRAGTCVIGTADCESVAPYFQASNCSPPGDKLDGTAGTVALGAELASPTTSDWYGVALTTGALTLHKRDCGNTAVTGSPNLASIRRYIARIYFIANNDCAGDGLPSLKMAELRGTTWTTSTIASGIEQLTVEYGQDTAGDTTAESYVTAPTTVAGWRQIVSVKLHLLTRNSAVSPDYTETGRTYVLGATTFGPFTDKIRRHAFTGLVTIRNPVGLRGG